MKVSSSMATAEMSSRPALEAMLVPSSSWKITIERDPALMINDSTVSRRVNQTSIAFLARLGLMF